MPAPRPWSKGSTACSGRTRSARCGTRSPQCEHCSRASDYQPPLTARELLAQAARAAGRDQIPTVTAYVPVALGPDEDSAARTAARWLTTYCTQMGPVYPRVLREWGYAAEIDALMAANTDPRAAVLPAGAVRLAREVLVFGTFGQASQAMSQWRTHADRLALTLPFGLAHDDLADVVEALAEASGW